jgi:cytochrome b
VFKNKLLKKNLKVWDLPVRLMHWALVFTMIAAWFTSDMVGAAHEWIGYGAGLLVAMRVIWGGIGNRYARFSQFLKSLPATLDYFRSVLSSNVPRYIGHNPLGGWMAVALLVCVGLLTISGWAMSTDLLWGYAWPVLVHVSIAWGMLILIVLHVLGVLFTSWQHRENLLKAMVTGEKAAPEPDDVN